VALGEADPDLLLSKHLVAPVLVAPVLVAPVLVAPVLVAPVLVAPVLVALVLVQSVRVLMLVDPVSVPVLLRMTTFCPFGVGKAVEGLQRRIPGPKEQFLC
jgi:hypothetical protein